MPSCSLFGCLPTGCHKAVQVAGAAAVKLCRHHLERCAGLPCSHLLGPLPLCSLAARYCSMSLTTCLGKCHVPGHCFHRNHHVDVHVCVFSSYTHTITHTYMRTRIHAYVHTIHVDVHVAEVFKALSKSIMVECFVTMCIAAGGVLANVPDSMCTSSCAKLACHALVVLNQAYGKRGQSPQAANKSSILDVIAAALVCMRLTKCTCHKGRLVAVACVTCVGFPWHTEINMSSVGGSAIGCHSFSLCVHESMCKCWLVCTRYYLLCNRLGTCCESSPKLERRDDSPCWYGPVLPSKQVLP